MNENEIKDSRGFAALMRLIRPKQWIKNMFIFVPLFFGAFWKRATTQGALAAIFGGVGSWVLIEVLVGEASPVPPQLIGLGLSMLGMIAGSLLPQWVGHRLPGEDVHEALHHRAAAETHHTAEHPHLPR